MLLSFFLFLPVSAYAASDWITVAQSEDNGITWDAKTNTFQITKTRAGVRVATIIGRIINNNTKRMDLYKWYVSIPDCNAGLGKFVTLDISGKFLYDNDFVSKSGNVASTISDTICLVYKNIEQEKNAKSL